MNEIAKSTMNQTAQQQQPQQQQQQHREVLSVIDRCSMLQQPCSCSSSSSSPPSDSYRRPWNPRMEIKGPVISNSFNSSSSSSSSSSPAADLMAATRDIMAEVRLAKGHDKIQTEASASSSLDLGFREKAFSAAGAAFLSAIIVNPLDVVKTRLQAQAAAAGPERRSPYYQHRYLGPRMATFSGHNVFDGLKCPHVCPRGGVFGLTPVCPPHCYQYKGTWDVFYKIIRQEGFKRLWRGTPAGLMLAVPSVGIYLPCYDIFRDFFEHYSRENVPAFLPYAPLVAGSLARSLACITCSPLELARTRMQAQKGIPMGVKPPGIWKTLFNLLASVKSGPLLKNPQGLLVLWTGVGAQLARDVPFSAVCWATLEPVRRNLLGLLNDESNASSILGANFSAGFVAGSIAAGVTCPLDVAKTRRQIERDPMKAMRTSTVDTLRTIWREGGVKGLFMGAGPRIARAGPSVGIVVSFYEVVKYLLQTQVS